MLGIRSVGAYNDRSNEFSGGILETNRFDFPLHFFVTVQLVCLGWMKVFFILGRKGHKKRERRRKVTRDILT